MATLRIAADADAVAEAAADRVAALVRATPAAVLGLPTGDTPLGLYRRLCARHAAGTIDLSRVRCFNLDEYHPIAADDPQSYHAYMRRELFDHVTVAAWRLPDGVAPLAQVDAACSAYEDAIAAAGGIDLQILGIGRTGHLGFNEPGASADSRTHRVELHTMTRSDAALRFGGLAAVPTHALTMGMGTILAARRILVLVTGAAKAGIVARALRGAIDPAVPASLLQTHPAVELLLDPAAAAALS